MQRPLMNSAEYWLHEPGATLLLCLIVLRGLLGLVIARELWLFDTHLAGGSLLLALLYLSGTFLPPRFGRPLGYLLGALAWLGSLALLVSLTAIPPRYVWPWYDLPTALVWTAVAVFIGAAALRWGFARQWNGQLRSHGFAWIRRWAEGRPFYARLLAHRTLRTLGYRGDR